MLLNTPHERALGRRHLERDTARLSEGELDVFRQVPRDEIGLRRVLAAEVA